MDFKVIYIALWCVFILSIMIHFLVGLIKGFRYSIYAFISLILFYVIFFVSMDVVSKTIIRTDIKSVLDSLGYDNCNNIVDLVTLLVNNNFQSIASEIPDLNYLIEAICQIGAKIIYFIVLALIYSIVSAIFYQFIKKRNLYKEAKYVSLSEKNEKYKLKHKTDNPKFKKKMDKMLKNKNYKKKRLLGGLVHGFRGVMCCILSLCIINSVVSVVPNLENTIVTADNNETKTQTLYEYILSLYPEAETALNIISEYQDSTLNNSTKVIKINGKTLDEFIMDAILSGDFDGTPLEIRDLIQTFATIGTDLFVATNGFDMKSVNYLNLTDDQQVRIQRVLNSLADNKFIIHIFPIAISYAMSLEQTKDFLSKNNIDISLIDFSTIDWKKDLKTLSEVVENVYILDKDLDQIDFLNAPEDEKDEVISYVDKVLTSLSKLTFLDVAINIGIQFAVNLEALNPYKNQIVNALNDVVWSEELTSINDVYKAFVDLAIGVLFDKNDDQNKINILELITSKEESKYTALIDSIFSSQFISNIFPEVMKIAKNLIKDEQIKELINIDIIGQNGWKEEMYCIIKLISELSSNGSEPISDIKLSIHQIQNISTSTILQSRLLSSAAIKFLIDSSDSNTTMIEGLDTYIDMPENLKQYTITDQGIIYNNDWFDGETVYGELHMMLEVIKNLLGSIEDINNPMASLPELLASLDLKKLNNPNLDSITDSKILHYTLSKTLLQLSSSSDVIIIPDEILNSDGVIKEEEIDSIINSLSNVIDISPLLVEVEENDKVVTKLDLSNPKKILNIFVNLLEGDEADNNLNTIFSSTILRSTTTKFIKDLGDLIVIPSNCLEEYTFNNQTISVINKDETIKLIKSINSIGMDYFISVNGDSIDIDQIVSKVVATTNRDFLDSMIIQATISKQILNYDNVLTIPSSVIEVIDTDTKIINKAELNQILDSLNTIGIGSDYTINDFATSIDVNMFFDFTENDLDEILKSQIFLATVGDKIKEAINSSESLSLPDVEIIDVETGKLVNVDYVNLGIDKQEIIRLINSIKILLGDNIDLNNFTFNANDFLEKQFSDEDIIKICSSKIISYNIGIIIEEENTIVGTFKNVLELSDVNWFYEEGSYKGDLVDLLGSLNKMYSNKTLKPLFEEFLNGNNSVGLSDLLNVEFCDYLTRSRVLINSFERFMPIIINKNNSQIINVNINDLSFPTENKQEYYRGEAIIDGELYKFIEGMVKVSTLDNYTTIEDKDNMLNDVKVILSSDLLNQTVTIQLFEKVEVLNMILQLQGQEPLEIPDYNQPGFNLLTYNDGMLLDSYITTYLTYYSQLPKTNNK